MMITPFLSVIITDWMKQGWLNFQHFHQPPGSEQSGQSELQYSVSVQAVRMEISKN